VKEITVNEYTNLVNENRSLEEVVCKCRILCFFGEAVSSENNMIDEILHSGLNNWTSQTGYKAVGCFFSVRNTVW
jgi:hypothetical protein